MTPGARLAAAIEILDEAEATRLPLDRALERWAKGHRYAGSKDRAAISARVYDVMRARALIDARWPGANARERVFASLKLIDALPCADIQAMASDGKYAPGALSEAEEAKLDALQPASGDDPRWVRLNYPAWLDERFEAAFPGRVEEELAALNRPAPVDLRANLLKTSRDGLLQELGEEGIEAQPTYWSPWGIRLASPRRLRAVGAIREGAAEIQDEGSQLVSALVGARPGERIVDYCAGAGGKTLAMGAMMAGEGEILACDVDGRRLARLKERAKRAGLYNVTAKVHEPGGMSGMEARADRVLLDVPCSGTGTWRRQPEARWRLTPEEFETYGRIQREILEEAAPIVRPGGALIYVTCSFFREENEDQIARFLAAHDEFEVVDWRLQLPEGWPVPAPGKSDYLRLSPASTGTDGFFAALLGRRL